MAGFSLFARGLQVSFEGDPLFHLYVTHAIRALGVVVSRESRLVSVSLDRALRSYFSFLFYRPPKRKILLFTVYQGCALRGWPFDAFVLASALVRDTRLERPS